MTSFINLVLFEFGGVRVCRHARLRLPGRRTKRAFCLALSGDVTPGRIGIPGCLTSCVFDTCGGWEESIYIGDNTGYQENCALIHSYWRIRGTGPDIHNWDLYFSGNHSERLENMHRDEADPRESVTYDFSSSRISHVARNSLGKSRITFCLPAGGRCSSNIIRLAYYGVVSLLYIILLVN